MWRSLLFVPILNDRLITGAARRNADAIVLDLEAAVPADRKNEARERLAQVMPKFAAMRSDIAVRVNPMSDTGGDDICAATAAGVDVIVLPHACPGSVQDAAKAVGTTPLIPLIESPLGVIEALQIAETDGVVGLGFGVEDYAAAMDAEPTPTLLEPAAFQVIQATRAAGRAPFVCPDTIADYADATRFEAAALKGRAMGSSGGFAIHPTQVEILNRVFRPSAKAISEAQEIVAALDEARANGSAVASLHGQMIDAPIETRARSILALEKRFPDQIRKNPG